MDRQALRQIAHGVWCVEGGLRMPLVPLPLRMSLIKLKNGELLVYSPIHISDGVAKELAGLGSVKHIIAPSGFHHLFVREMAQRFPNARLYASPALREKCADVPWHGFLGDEPLAPWAEEVDQHLIAGAPRIDEVVIFHKASKTLFVADLLFNIQEPKGWAAPILFGLLGTYKKFAMSRLWKRFVKDPQALKQSLERVRAWEIERVVMGHGSIAQGIHAKVLEKALRL